MVPARQTGFVQARNLRTILVEDGEQTAESGLIRRAVEGLQTGFLSPLPVALAQNRDAGSGGRGYRP